MYIVHESPIYYCAFAPASRQPPDSPPIDILSEIGSDDEHFSDTGDNSDRQNTGDSSGGQGNKGNEDDAEDGDKNGEDDQDDAEKDTEETESEKEDDQEDEDASNWSVDRVATWLVDVLGNESDDVVQIFTAQHIDGSVFLVSRKTISTAWV